MAVRKDGIESSRKLLKAASEVFAERGYLHATIAEICRRANCNVASINYHFRSKDGLYAMVWKNAFEQAMKVYPADGGLPSSAPAEKRFAALVRSSLHRVLDDGRLGCSGQILLREMADPTDVVDQIMHDAIEPLRRQTRQIIGELLGSEPDEQQLMFCEMSVVHQCIALGFGKGRNKLPPFLQKDRLTSEFIDKLAEHITFFSLAGIQAVCQRAAMKQKASGKPENRRHSHKERNS